MKKKLTSKKGKGIKKVKKIAEFYYMINQQVTVKELADSIDFLPEEKIEIWPQLDLMEIVLESDSLIFQNAKEAFIDPLDLEFIDGHQIKTIYQISFEEDDKAVVKKVLQKMLDHVGGMICSDTEEFEPIYNPANIHEL